ncbi:MAG: PilZ domain-containing protein [Terriglobales bacterium]
MPQTLIDVLMLGRCSHEFSWPRRTAAGDYYQVCMLCANAYRYDWKTMRRGERVEEPLEEAGTARRRSGLRQPRWTPRARRVKLKTPIRYRGKNLTTWYEGVTQNISQSGVMFSGPQQLPVNALLELIFEMPEEISGQSDSNVLCQGRVVRVKDAVENAEDAFGLAATILDYKFIRPR